MVPDTLIVEQASIDSTEKVTVDVYKRVGDNTDAFFIGFRKRGGIEYLMLPKNGELNPARGPHHVPNRHDIESFEIFKEGDQWLMKATRKSLRNLS